LAYSNDNLVTTLVFKHLLWYLPASQLATINGIDITELHLEHAILPVLRISANGCFIPFYFGWLVVESVGLPLLGEFVCILVVAQVQAIDHPSE